MKCVTKIGLLLVGLVLLAIVGACGWFFLYTRDLPDFGRLSRFTPSEQTIVEDACLAGPSNSIPFEQIGEQLKNALATTEPATTQIDQIARSLMCNHSEGMGKYQLNAFRLGWHVRRNFSDQQLLTIYLNRAYFGEGMTGIENACGRLFQKEPNALNAGEAALAIGLLRAPGYFSPSKYPDRAQQRRNEVLQKMAAQGKLSASDAERFEAEPVLVR